MTSAVRARVGLVVLGLFISLLLLEAGMRAAGWMIDFSRHRENRSRLVEGSDFRILCLGESTTVGEFGTISYPTHLQGILEAQLQGFSVSVINGGRFGTETDFISRDLAGNLATHSPDLVITMMGVNDAGKTHSYGSVIEPGTGRWFGSMRVYKLYRVLRVGLQRRLFGESRTSALIKGDGIASFRRGDGPAVNEQTLKPAFVSTLDQVTSDQIEHARELSEQSKYAAAEQVLRDILFRQPTNVPACIELNFVLRHTNMVRQAHEVLLACESALPLPSVEMMESLANSYEALGLWQQAAELLVELRRHYIPARQVLIHVHYARALARVHENAGQIDEAEKFLREIVEELKPGDDRLYPDLIEFCERHGRWDEAARLRGTQHRIRNDYLNPSTRRNYLRVRSELEKRGIGHIAVQYPGRDVDRLKRLLDHDERTIFVDNSHFADLVGSLDQELYFSDLFAGDFGHLTSLGNRMLAENIARAIVEQHFGLEFTEDVCEDA